MKPIDIVLFYNSFISCCNPYPYQGGSTIDAKHMKWLEIAHEHYKNKCEMYPKVAEKLQKDIENSKLLTEILQLKKEKIGLEIEELKNKHGYAFKHYL